MPEILGELCGARYSFRSCLSDAASKAGGECAMGRGGAAVAAALFLAGSLNQSLAQTSWLGGGEAGQRCFGNRATELFCCLPERRTMIRYTLVWDDFIGPAAPTDPSLWERWCFDGRRTLLECCSQ